MSTGLRNLALHRNIHGTQKGRTARGRVQPTNAYGHQFRRSYQNLAIQLFSSKFLKNNLKKELYK